MFVCLPVFTIRDAIGPGHLYPAETLPHHQKCPGALQWTGKMSCLYSVHHFTLRQTCMLISLFKNPLVSGGSYSSSFVSVIQVSVNPKIPIWFKKKKKSDLYPLFKPKSSLWWLNITHLVWSVHMHSSMVRGFRNMFSVWALGAAFFHFKTSPLSTSVVKKDAAKLFCCEAPQCFVTWLFISMSW